MSAPLIWRHADDEHAEAASRVGAGSAAVSELRVLANLCSVVSGRVGGSEEYATRLLAAASSLISSRDGGAPLTRPDSAGPAGAAGQRGSGPRQPSGPRAETTAQSGAGTTAPRLALELAAMAGVRQAHPELVGCVWHETRLSGRNRLMRLAVESTWLERRAGDFDVVHHFGGRIPARRRGTAVVTIHDLQPLELPENFSAVKRRYLQAALKRSSQAAALVTTPSAWVAERVVELLGVAPDAVRVVPATYPSHPVFTRSADGAARGATEPRGGAEPWSGRAFILYPAATYPHKNHALLIAAHAAVRARRRDAWLVLTGGRGRAHNSIAGLVARTPGVVHLGRVDRTRLASLFSAAAGVAFPSRYEGFGLPVLEAMAAGTPVVAASAAALPEVVGGAGQLVDPDDIDGWADALAEVLDGSPGVDRRVERGRIRARCYTPEKAASRLVDSWMAAGLAQP